MGKGASDWGQVTSGVPQGSVLGPILFLVYANEIPSLLKSRVKMFADDIKIYSTLQDSQDPLRLQEDLNVLSDWSKDWLLKLNPGKCKVMHCGTDNLRTDYLMKDANDTVVKLQETALETDL